MISFEYIDFWPKSLLFRTHHLKIPQPKRFYVVCIEEDEYKLRYISIHLYECNIFCLLPLCTLRTLELIERINGCVKQVPICCMQTLFCFCFCFFFFVKGILYAEIFALNLLECLYIFFFFYFLCRYIGSTIKTYTPG